MGDKGEGGGFLLQLFYYYHRSSLELFVVHS